VWLPCAGPPGTGELRISDFGLRIGQKGSHARARGRGEDGEKGAKERGRDGGTEGQRDKGTWGTRRHGVLSIEYSAAEEAVDFVFLVEAFVGWGRLLGIPFEKEHGTASKQGAK